MHEAVSNHFNLAVNDDGTQFLMNRNQVHFSRITASSLLLLDANTPATLATMSLIPLSVFCRQGKS